MLTKHKVKRYLKTKETWTLFDEVLNFYTSIHLTEVLKFWGLRHLQFHVDFVKDMPVLLTIQSKLNHQSIEIVFSPDSCAINSTYNHDLNILYRDLTLNDLFDAIRSELQL